MGVAGLDMVVDIEQGGDDQLHPQFLDLVDDLELKFVSIDELLERFLAGEQVAGIEIKLVVEFGRGGHQVIIVLAVHGVALSENDCFFCILFRDRMGNNFCGGSAPVNFGIVAFHQGFGQERGLETILGVKAMGVARRQHEAAQAQQVGMRDDRIHQRFRVAVAAIIRRHEDIDQVGEGGEVGMTRAKATVSPPMTPAKHREFVMARSNRSRGMPPDH